MSKMLAFRFRDVENRALRILCLGAHSDDIEIGCSGTLLRMINDGLNIRIHWVVLGAMGIRTEEAVHSAEKILSDVKEKKITVMGFRDGFFPYHGEEIKEYFEQLKGGINPDIIFTHFRQDLHQDHRLIAELTWNTFRNHLILEYEIPKYDGDLSSPNFFVHLNQEICERKIFHLLSSFKTQSDKHWFTDETFWALLRLRGIESKSPGKYAEAFYCRKIVF